jgi:UPF0716 protein FxsA
MPRLAGLAGIGLVVAIVAEIAVFIVVAHWLGVGLTLLLLVATSLLGGWLLRREGGRAWRALREAGMAGRPDLVAGVNQGVLGRLLGGLLLAIPGFLTDVAGLALLVPAVRRFAGAGVQRLAERRMPSAMAGEMFGPRRVRVRPGQPYRTAPQGGGSPIEGEIIDPS